MGREVRRGIYWKGYFVAFVRTFLLETNEMKAAFDCLSPHVSQLEKLLGVSQIRNCWTDFD
jgi:hypothetical protein